MRSVETLAFLKALTQLLPRFADFDGLPLSLCAPFVDLEDSWVIVVAAQTGGFKAISDEFDVTEEGEPGENLFTRTNIFLIAVGDAGSSGEEIGCGDSVIPVEVEIKPTIAPLTAALNELFALNSREYGQSGLYNALYRSDLTVEGIDIENREAIITLSGDLVVGEPVTPPASRRSCAKPRSNIKPSIAFRSSLIISRSTRCCHSKTVTTASESRAAQFLSTE